MTRPEAILFDLWGTLIHSDGGFNPGQGNAAFLKGCVNPRAATLEQVEALGTRVITGLEKREDVAALEFTQASLLSIIGDSLGLRFPRGLQEAEWDFWSAALNITLIEGVRDLLSFLRRLGIRMGVVSNSSFSTATLERELDRHGIRHEFAFVISSAEYGVRKPDPIIFEVALARLGIPAESAWFAGDNVEYDVMGARAAGIFPVAFNPRAPIPASAGEHVVITEWSQLGQLVEAASS
ncbi:MAG: HAD family hydrolase [Spirochaetia bacterium]|jgi:putative hydrolase of the HAD superfamily